MMESTTIYLPGPVKATGLPVISSEVREKFAYLEIGDETQHSPRVSIQFATNTPEGRKALHDMLRELGAIAALVELDDDEKERGGWAAADRRYNWADHESPEARTI